MLIGSSFIAEQCLSTFTILPIGLIEFRYTGGNEHNRKSIFLTKKGRSVASAILKSLRNPYAPMS